MLEIGREAVFGEAADSLLAEAADELVKRRCSERRRFFRSFPRQREFQHLGPRVRGDERTKQSL
jgi:hypothetical protein